LVGGLVCILLALDWVDGCCVIGVFVCVVVMDFIGLMGAGVGWCVPLAPDDCLIVLALPPPPLR
jgi:hypothetical protein